MQSRDQSLAGALCAFGAFTWWGLVPVYFKLTASVPAMEVLAHRVVWSTLLLGIVLGSIQGWRVLVMELRSLRRCGFYLLTALLLSTNWLIFIWAIQNSRVAEASLGYFINPLVNVLLGMLFLGERLRRLQAVAVLLAAAGVINELVTLGRLPWVSLALASSFGLYGLLRKKAALNPSRGLLMETLLMTPAALTWLAILWAQGQQAFSTQDVAMDLLLISAGVVTTVPLFLFLEGAQRIRLSTLGLMQYVAPTLQLILAVVWYHEPFERSQMLTFGLIWVALAVVTIDGFLVRKALLAGRRTRA